MGICNDAQEDSLFRKERGDCCGGNVSEKIKKNRIQKQVKGSALGRDPDNSPVGGKVGWELMEIFC